MHMALEVATLLGGISALWFLYDKRIVITGWFRVSVGNSLNPLSLPDEEFMFLDDKSSLLLRGAYSPVSDYEEGLCRSLVNLKALKSVGNRQYKLTSLSRRMLKAKYA